MNIDNVKRLIAKKQGVSVDSLSVITPTHSEEIKQICDAYPEVYNRKNQCYQNSALLVAMDVSSNVLDYALTYAVRVNDALSVALTSTHPEILEHMQPLSSDSYVFGHALVYNKYNNEYYDPTLQDSKAGFADHYFLVDLYDDNDLEDYLNSNDGIAPSVTFQCLT